MPGFSIALSKRERERGREREREKERGREGEPCLVPHQCPGGVVLGHDVEPSVDAHLAVD